MSRRYTEQAGARRRKIEEEEVQRLETSPSRRQKGADKLQVSADGAMVPLLRGEWAEVKTVVIGVVQPAVEERGEWVVHTRQSELFLAVGHGRGVSTSGAGGNAPAGCGSGQSGGGGHGRSRMGTGFYRLPLSQCRAHPGFAACGGTLEPGRASAIRRTYSAGAAVVEQPLAPTQTGGAWADLSRVRTISPATSSSRQIEANRSYLEKRQNQLNYPLFRAQGWPIGSGIVESGNKLVVEARLKGSGMHWAERMSIQCWLCAISSVVTAGNRNGLKSKPGCANGLSCVNKNATWHETQFSPPF